MSLPSKLSGLEALTILQEIVRDGGVVVFRDHWSARIRERHITPRDVEAALAHGEIAKDPEWSSKYSNWEFAVKTEIDGDWYFVGVALDETADRRPRLFIAVTTAWV